MFPLRSGPPWLLCFLPICLPQGRPTLVLGDGGSALQGVNLDRAYAPGKPKMCHVAGMMMLRRLPFPCLGAETIPHTAQHAAESLTLTWPSFQAVLRRGRVSSNSILSKRQWAFLVSRSVFLYFPCRISHVNWPLRGHDRCYSVIVSVYTWVVAPP